MRKKELIKITTYNEMQNKKLEECYIIIHIIKIKIGIKPMEKVVNKDIQIMYGVNIRGQKTVIGIFEEDINNNRYWLETIEYIKIRGLKKILFVSMEVNNKLEQALKIVYNKVNIVPSVVKIVSDIASFTQYKWQSEGEKEILKAFLVDDILECENELVDIKDKYKENKVAIILIDRYTSDIKSYYKYKKEIRHLFCSYFTIKAMKNNIIRVDKRREYYNNIEDIFNELLEYYTLFEQTRSYTKRKWVLILNEIYSMFGEEIEGYIV